VEPLDQVLRPLLGCRPADPVTTEAQVQRYFRDAAVRAFACTHTCLPFAQGFLVDGRWHLLINNGAAGMPNFRGMTTGLITRISDQPAPPPASLYGAQVGGARFDAIPVAYDHAAWTERFLRNWPAGSAAHRSYFERIDRGPNFHLVQAIRRGVQPGAAANAAE
jgi:hypothetical protein